MFSRVTCLLPFSLGDWQRVVNVPVTITQVRSGERSSRTCLPFPIPTSARVELVPEHEMAQLEQGWELGLQPSGVDKWGDPGGHALGLREQPG